MPGDHAWLCFCTILRWHQQPCSSSSTRLHVSTHLQEEPSEEEEQDDATWAKNVTAGKLSKGEKLMAVDHSTINYPPFRRNFYIEVPDIKRMDEAEVATLRKELDGIKVGEVAGDLLVSFGYAWSGCSAKQWRSHCQAHLRDVCT